MNNANHLKSKASRPVVILGLIFLMGLWCQNLLASQSAIIIAEEAVIYSDPEMTGPIGYISKGKKVIVGEIARNNAQVYPIIVSGKIAYIRVVDISSEKENTDSERLTAERFQKSAFILPESKFSMSYFLFSSEIDSTFSNGDAKDGDVFLWQGVSVKGEVLVAKVFDVEAIVNYQSASFDNETYQSLEIGPGLSYRFLRIKKFLARLEAQLLAIPYSSYSLGEDFRINSYGYSMGAGLNLSYYFKKKLALEAYGGMYRTELGKFKTPSPYRDTSASFVGNRFGIGLSVTY